MVRTISNHTLLYERIHATLIGSEYLDAHNKDLLAVTKDMNQVLKKSQRISQQEKSKVSEQIQARPQAENDFNRTQYSGIGFKAEQ